MRIFLDMDGVIADYLTGVRQLFAFNGAWPVGEGHCPTVIGVNEEDYHQYIHECVGWWERLRMTDEATRILAIVERYDSEYHILSKPVTQPAGNTSASQKIHWIRKHLGHKRYILCKDKSLLIGPDRVLIDDDDANTRHWGRNGFLFPRITNSRHTETDNWEALLERFLHGRAY